MARFDNISKIDVDEHITVMVVEGAPIYNSDSNTLADEVGQAFATVFTLGLYGGIKALDDRLNPIGHEEKQHLVTGPSYINSWGHIAEPKFLNFFHITNPTYGVDDGLADFLSRGIHSKTGDFSQILSKFSMCNSDETPYEQYNLADAVVYSNWANSDPVHQQWAFDGTRGSVCEKNEDNLTLLHFTEDNEYLLIGPKYINTWGTIAHGKQGKDPSNTNKSLKLSFLKLSDKDFGLDSLVQDLASNGFISSAAGTAADAALPGSGVIVSGIGGSIEKAIDLGQYFDEAHNMRVEDYYMGTVNDAPLDVYNCFDSAVWMNYMNN